MSFGAYHWGGHWSWFWSGLSHWKHKSWHHNCHDDDEDDNDNVQVNTAPDAQDDSAMVVAGDPAILISVLDNDDDDEGDPLTISAVTTVLDANGNDVGAAATIVGNQVSFDPTGLEPGDYTFTYTIEDGGTEVVTTTRTIDFEEFSAGDKITDQIEGVDVKVWYGGSRDAMIFDAENPTGGDHDLGVAEQGNLLIISEDGDSSDPDDEAHGGKIEFRFDDPTDVDSITLVDVEEGAYIYAYNDHGHKIGKVKVHRGEVGDGEVKVVDLGFEDVSKLKVKLKGSGAIDDIVLSEETEVPTSDTATVNVTVKPAQNVEPLLAADDTLQFFIDQTDLDLENGGSQSVSGLNFPIAGLLDNDQPLNPGIELDRITIDQDSFTLNGQAVASVDFLSFGTDAEGDVTLTSTLGDPNTGSLNGIDMTEVTFEYFATDDETGQTTETATATLQFVDLF